MSIHICAWAQLLNSFIWRLLLVAAAAYIYAQLLLFLPFYYSLLILLFFLVILLCFLHSKLIVYIMIFMYPILPLFYQAIQDRGGVYAGINIGGFINIAITLVGIVLIVYNRSTIQNFRFKRIALVFLAILAMGVLISPQKFNSLRMWFRYSMPVMFYFIILIFFKHEKKVSKLLKFSFCFASLIPIAMGIDQLVLRKSKYVVIGLSRVCGSFAHPNTFAMFLVVFLLLSVYFMSVEKGWRKAFYISMFIVMLVLLYGTFTRIAWISFVFAFTLLGIIRYRKTYFLVLPFLLSAFLLVPSVSRMMVERLKPDSSFFSRFELVRIGVKSFFKSPLYGNGLNTYQLFSGQEMGTRWYGARGLVAHNEYIRFLADGGLIGLAVFLFLFYKAIIFALSLTKTKYSPIKNYGVFLLGLVASIMLLSISDQGYEYAAFYFWIILACGELMLSNMTDNQIDKQGSISIMSC